MKVLLFAGATEGHTIAVALDRAGVELTVSVATEYGAQLLGPLRTARVLTGRMEVPQMCRAMTGCDVVVDATHPYAVAASANIAAAARQCGVRLLRVQRQASNVRGLTTVADAAAAARVAAAERGNILLTTGSKELPAFADIPRQRLYVRVLPSIESITACQTANIPPSNIIAMQGPFTMALNQAILRQYAIRLLITKDGGRAGGFSEKVAAAQSAGVRTLVIRRPEEATGLTTNQIIKELTS